MTGYVFDIKKFAIHDGPGIRSTLFLKGCPLKCVWCHNPEGIDGKRGLWFFEKRCIRCGSCADICPVEALAVQEDRTAYISINRDMCTTCGKCVEVCPSTALSFDSSAMSADEAVHKLLQDQPFYSESGGGITISGGDPLYQHRFSREVLGRCRAEGVHTAIETSMQAAPDVLASFIGLVDLFIVDIKLFDCRKHKEYTGMGNETILSNFKMLAESKQQMLVRIPLIPGITATEDNISDVSRFVAEHSPGTAIELINFNPLAESKYRLMDREFAFLTEMKPFDQERIDQFYALIEREGLPVIRETVRGD